MNNNRITRPIFGLVILVLSALACNLPGTNANPEFEVAATETMQALETIIAGTLQPKVADDHIQMIEEPAPEQQGSAGLEAHVIASPEATVTPTITPTIVHHARPSSPGAVQNWISDRSTRPLASERRAIADNFAWNLLERPYTGEVMDYLEHLDITRAELSMNAPWVYITIHLEGPPPDGSQASYAVEIDLDIDGRGDWLITGIVPPSSNWTTDGVQAWRDTDNDVGGLTPIHTDAPHPSRNGYDDLVFDQGLGVDPDAAWIRRAPSSSDRVQLAFKHTLIGSDGEFMWGAWADEWIKEPAWLDYNDHFSQEEAGSPATESSQYPIKALAEVDNTCRWGYGFTPTGAEPGVCFVPPTPTPTVQTPPGKIVVLVFKDLNMNGVVDDGGEDGTGIGGARVRIGRGRCPSTGHASTSTYSNGLVYFTDLPAGRYCVSVDTGTLPSQPYGWHATTPVQATVNLDPGETLGIPFGFLEIVG
ncbi:MAG: hypothetical protein GTO14_16595 [Anaerolineales bacterium]|nr:hypothetical protein [Anaerolineales bacterium]